MSAARRTVDVSAVQALMRAFQLECEGGGQGVSPQSLPPDVAGYFWPDDQAHDRERDGRSPLGVVLARIGVEMDNCTRLSPDERLLLSRRHGLAGAVRRLTTTGAGSMLTAGGSTADGQLRPVEIAHARTILGRAYSHLAQTLTPRPDVRPTVPNHRPNPVLAPWFEQHARLQPDDHSRSVVSIALGVARQWCAVGGSRQDTLFADLSCWHDCVVRGCTPLGVTNLRRRLSRANAYVGIALYWTIVTHQLVDPIGVGQDRNTCDLPALPAALRELLPEACLALAQRLADGLHDSTTGRRSSDRDFTSAPQVQCMSSTD